MIPMDQVTALAPDAASYKAGKALAHVTKWAELKRNEHYLWGLSKGSGSKPYQTQIALEDLATKCSCPSRKFPCKHALGLMFIAAEDPTQFTESELDDWVQEWNDARQVRLDKKQESKKKRAAKPVNKSTAQATKRKRALRVDEGVAFLNDFLLDLIRDGLSKENVRSQSSWDGLVRRLIDCQAPGLAGLVRGLAEIPYSGTGWETRLLHEMGSLYHLLHGYQARDAMNEQMQSELEKRIGWTVAKESVLNGDAIADDWFVAYRTISNVDKVKVFSNWLFGKRNQQWALLLEFGSAGMAPKEIWPVGSTVSTELAFYPGLGRERALAVAEHTAINLNEPIDAEPETIDQMLERISHRVATNPWQSRHPSLLLVQPTMLKNEAVLVDDHGQSIPWKARKEEQLLLETVCGGNTVLLAGEWNSEYFKVYTVSDNGSWFQMADQLDWRI